MRLVRNAEEVREGWMGSHAAAEVLEGYFIDWGVFPLRSVGSKPQAILLNLQHQRERNPDNIQL